jgi:putative methionine-R-sulfoxide reductase with GAF domain
MSSASEALQALDGILDRGGDADDVLRQVVAALQEEGGYAWAGIFFVEAGALVLGPAAGDAQPEGRTTVPVTWQGERVAELAVDGAAAEDRAALERVAALVAGHCLVGWDTGGEPWRP